MPISIQRLLCTTLFTVAVACGGATAPEGHDGGTRDGAPDVTSTCKAVTLCPMQGCDNPTQCCAGLTCMHNRCVAPTGVCCTLGSDCLSDTCTGGACACSVPGSSCETGTDCCGGGRCMGAGTFPGTCQ
jgi:hypothetical protein